MIPENMMDGSGSKERSKVYMLVRIALMTSSHVLSVRQLERISRVNINRIFMPLEID